MQSREGEPMRCVTYGLWISSATDYITDKHVSMIISHGSIRDNRYKTKSKDAYIKEKVMQELVLKVAFYLKLIGYIIHIYKFSLPSILAAIV